MSKTLFGSCLCGSITYEVVGEIAAPSLCNCRMCQKQHGAPFGAYGMVKWADFHITRGIEQLARYRSSPTVTRTFCQTRGSTLQFVRDPRDGFGLAVGTLDSEFSSEPAVQIFTQDKAH